MTLFKPSKALTENKNHKKIWSVTVSITVGEQITVEQLIEKRIIMRLSRHDHVYRHHIRDK